MQGSADGAADEDVYAAGIVPNPPAMPDLNNADPTPPPEAKATLEKNEQEQRALDSPRRTNDSTIDPEKPEDDILKGYHGG